MTDLEILKMHEQRIFNIIQDYGDVLDQIVVIKDLLRDVQGEVIIETSIIDGSERISKVDIRAKTINIFESLNLTSQHFDMRFIILSKMYAAYLWCEKTGDGKPLYDALLRYETHTHYPVTRCSVDDIETLKVEASVLIDETLVQPESDTSTDTPYPGFKNLLNLLK